MIRKFPKLFSSYSFSFTTKTSNNLRYFKKTTLGHTLNTQADEFILSFIQNAKPLTDNDVHVSPKRGRPKKPLKEGNIYAPFNFSLKDTTIKIIQGYKKKDNMPSLDVALEKYLNIQIPVRK